MCIAARVLNKMSMMTTVRHACRLRHSRGGEVTGYSHIRAPTFFLNRGPVWSKSGPNVDVHAPLQVVGRDVTRDCAISISYCVFSLGCTSFDDVVFVLFGFL